MTIRDVVLYVAALLFGVAALVEDVRDSYWLGVVLMSVALVLLGVHLVAAKRSDRR